MATILPYIPITSEHSELLATWYNVANKSPTFYTCIFPDRSKQDFDNLITNSVCYGTGENNIPEAVILGRDNEMYLFLVNQALSGKRQIIAGLSVSYWTLIEQKKLGYTTLWWEQFKNNTLLKWLNGHLPPLSIVPHGINTSTGESDLYIVTLDIEASLINCAAAIEVVK